MLILYGNQIITIMVISYNVIVPRLSEYIFITIATNSPFAKFDHLFFIVGFVVRLPIAINN